MRIPVRYSTRCRFVSRLTQLCSRLCRRFSVARVADRTRFAGVGMPVGCHLQKRAVWSMQHRLRVATSRIAGWGVFATKHIGVHDVIAEYMGEVVSGVVRLLLRCHTRRFASPAFMAAAATQLCSLVCSPRRVVGPGSGR